MLGAVRVELLSYGFFPGYLFIFAPPLGCLTQVVECRVHPVGWALMPYGVASALVAVDPFLLSTLFAVDGSEAHFDL